jgi:solute carrier family 13 (sodium-dependent dicarboxylate transporter), member 2/3/5
LRKLGRMTNKEIYTLIVFILTLILWATDKLHGYDATLVAMLTVLSIIVPGPQQVMTWKQAQAKVPWNILVVYGAGISLGTVLAQSGAASWIAQTFFSPLAVFSLKTQVVAFIWIMLILQVFFTGAAPKTTALTPVVLAYAAANGLNVGPFAILVAMNMIHQYLLPVSNLSNIIGLATEEITAGELMRTGAWLSIYAGAFMTLMVYTYWSWIGVV